MITFPNKKNTIPHLVEGKYKSAKVLMKPAAPGTGIIAGGSVRIVMEAAGVKDILAKSLGSKNSMNVLKAVFNGFSSLMSIGQIAKKRNKNISSVWG